MHKFKNVNSSDDLSLHSNINLSDDHKVNVLIAMMHDVRNSIDSWTNRSFQAVTWSGGILIAFIGIWLTKTSKVPIEKRIVLAVGILLFGSFIQAFMFRAKKAHKGNGNLLTKIEATLRLTEQNTYIQNSRFFTYTGKWVAPKSLNILQIINLIIIIFAILVTLLFN